MKARNPKSEIRKESEIRNSKFGNRTWFGLRPSFGLRISAFGFCLLSPLLLAAPIASPNAAPRDELPALLPPRPEIPPGFWEQHGVLFIVLGIIFIALAGAAIWYWTRPRPAPVVPPVARAREELAALRNQPEDGLVLSRVSQTVRHYIGAAFHLAPGEFTTPEFCRAIETSAAVGPDLAESLGSFLRECDRRKFSPAPMPAPPPAVPRALELVELAETRRARVSSPAAEGRPADGSPA